MADTDRYVPDEILNDILVRLPTKSLSRFRCVSKHWNRLITNPYFMKSISCRKIFIPGQFCQSIEKVVSGENMEYRMVMAHSPFQVKSVTVAGTIKGLVLLVLNFYSRGPCIVDMNLYNPLTRVFKKVPNPDYIYKTLAFGFGHDATQDDLKIVTLGVYKHYKSLFWGVFSVKNQSWSTMSESIGYYEFSSCLGTFLNGFLYWSVIKDSFSMLILALDIKEMMLLEIEVPYDRMYSITLGTINGCLCLIYHKHFCDGYQLLVMNDHGTWEPRLKECATSILSRMDYGTFDVMCILDEGKVIMKNYKENTFLIVDLLINSSERILVCTDFNQESTTQAIEYVESFCNI